MKQQTVKGEQHRYDNKQYRYKNDDKQETAQAEQQR
jgi:hypothetical protein